MEHDQITFYYVIILPSEHVFTVKYCANQLLWPGAFIFV